MEIYLKNMQGQEYKLVPAEPDHKTLGPVPSTVASIKPVPEPPQQTLD